MKLLFLAALSALPFLASAQVPIPLYNCGSASDHVKITSATASAWPLVPGTAATISVSGVLNENVVGGTYTLGVTFDGFPVVNQNGQLSSLPGWQPVNQGQFTVSKSITVPTVVPAGSNIVVNVTAADQNNQELVCFGLAVQVPSAKVEQEQEEDDSLEAGVFEVARAVSSGRTSFRSIVHALGDILADAVEGVVAASSELDAPTPVPYTNCGQPSDEFTIESITSSIWPPQLGQTAQLVVAFLANEEVADGTYNAVVSVDGFPLINKSGDISKYIAVPIQKGLVNITKAITLPSSLPISGSIGIQLSGTDSTTSGELFCVQIAFSI